MKERPILFSGAMVRAILDGRKTQTRRALKPQPPGATTSVRVFHHPDPRPHFWANDGACLLDWAKACPYGEVGDRLWVRETFCQKWCDQRGYLDEYLYRATEPDVVHPDGQDKSPWRPSIHMPRAASRITLEITGVRVERLQNISHDDAQAEGITDGCCVNCGESEADCTCSFCMPDYRDAYTDLWEQINGAGSWDANPWVWVVEFRRAAAAIGESGHE